MIFFIYFPLIVFLKMEASQKKKLKQALIIKFFHQ